MPYADDFQPQKHASRIHKKFRSYKTPIMRWMHLRQHLILNKIHFHLVSGLMSSATLSYSAADYQDMERRLKADNDARLQSRLDEMRLQLREEARQDMELMVQRMMSQRDQGYQPQQPQQHPQHIPARHSTYASSHPHQQQPRPSPQMPSRHSIHETS
ncbi:hypothetical protein P8452_25801 [Trifolium repens]|nr:hypothetical protein P8452_25801 [Trifolium repens]